MIAWLLALVAGARAAPELLAYSPRDEPRPGRPSTVELVAWDQGAPVEAPVLSVEAAGGEVEDFGPGSLPGTWWARIRPEDGVEGMVIDAVLAGGRRIEAGLPVAPRLRAPFQPPPPVDAVAGSARRLVLHFSGQPPGDGADLRGGAGEGRVVSVASAGGGVDLAWEPGEAAHARVVPVGLLDLSAAGSPPAWAVVRLHARPPVSVKTEPGTRMVLALGGRTYGPVVAGEDGRAEAVIDVRPGERVARATLESPAGGTQTTAVLVGPEPRPALAGVVEGELMPGGIAPAVHLAAVDSRGRPWSGRPPSCTAGSGGLEIRGEGPGMWRAELEVPREGLFFDLRVDCSLGDTGATTSVRVPVSRGIPSRLGLEVRPRELSSDAPEAQVLAWLEDLGGTRLPLEGLVLSAGHGRLSSLPLEGLALRSEYRADPAWPDDEIVARWFRPVGRGEPAAVSLELGFRDGAVEVSGRVIGRTGRPLPGRVVSAGMGPVRIEGRTGERGRFLATLVPPTGRPAVVELRCGDLVRRAAVLPWALPPALDPERADLVARVPVRVHSGSVARILISVKPAVLPTGTGRSARVEVRMLDRAGLPVADREVTVHASEGTVTPSKQREDGTLVAAFLPPPGVRAGVVELVATDSSGGFSAATRVELVPRPARRSIGLVAGWLAGSGGVAGPYGGLAGELRVRGGAPALHVRASAETWMDSSEVPDPDRGSTVLLRMDVLSIELAGLARWEHGLYAWWAGAGGLLAPFRLEASYESVPPVDSWGIHHPGAVLLAGAGRRLAGGEALVEGRWIGVRGAGGAVGYAGQVGGVAAVAGYRVVF